MKIISWNINGYRAITGQNSKRKFDTISNDNKLFEYIKKENPDIICLQETKVNIDQISADLITPLGYNYFYHSCRLKKGYSGTVVFTKENPRMANNNIGIENFDCEGRIVEVDMGDFILFNVYFPNGTSGDHRVQYKLEFYDSLFNYIENKRKTNPNIIVCGDYNIAHHEIDLARPKENIGTSGFLPIEREKLDWIEKLGFVDSFRLFNKEPNQYTWWSHRANARQNNVGWRIDYFFTTENMRNEIISSYHQPNEEGSDHCPIILELK